jgi:hypothetical protein
MELDNKIDKFFCISDALTRILFHEKIQNYLNKEKDMPNTTGRFLFVDLREVAMISEFCK